MNYHRDTNLNLAPDGAHRHLEIEKVQKDILQQHKHIETQLNQLKEHIRHMCNSNGINCGSVDFNNFYNRRPSMYPAETNFQRYGIRKF